MEIETCVRGFHEYYKKWNPVVGEILHCKRQANNSHDKYAVAVTKAEEIVGHLPRKISRLCSLFLRRGGRIVCEVTGRRRYSSDLSQGGLEIPCKLKFTGTCKELDKMSTLLSQVVAAFAATKETGTDNLE